MKTSILALLILMCVHLSLAQNNGLEIVECNLLAKQVNVECKQHSCKLTSIQLGTFGFGVDLISCKRAEDTIFIDGIIYVSQMYNENMDTVYRHADNPVKIYSYSGELKKYGDKIIKKQLLGNTNEVGRFSVKLSLLNPEWIVFQSKKYTSVAVFICFDKTN